MYRDRISTTKTEILNFKKYKMKTIIKQLMIALLLLVSIEGFGQYVAIPDSNFGTWLNANGYINCIRGNNTAGWSLDTTCSPVINDSVIDCHHHFIRDLAGIQYFKNLKRLFADSNQLSSLHTLPTSLTTFSCQQCGLTSLSTLPPNLAPSQRLHLLHSKRSS